MGRKSPQSVEWLLFFAVSVLLCLLAVKAADQEEAEYESRNPYDVFGPYFDYQQYLEVSNFSFHENIIKTFGKPP
jgi:hypothetical protein